MSSFRLVPQVVDKAARQSAIECLRRAKLVLPTWRQLSGPFEAGSQAVPADVDPDKPLPANLWRVHWFNSGSRKELVDVPGHVVLPKSLTGVKAPIVVLLGCRFPMIGAHKVLAAYACLVPRLATGQFDPRVHKAIWPSTGNYCRGGVAISRILGCHGVAVMPEGMSRERFDWLSRWVLDPSDIIRTPGTESNVKEIYDTCAELERNPENVILNQFSEFANYLIHHICTGAAFERVFDHLKQTSSSLRLAAFVASTGSAGTLAAGDPLKDRHGTKIVAVEALECPTMLNNGYGEHNIQGIGDKHIPLIHNVMNTDAVVGVTDTASDALNHLFGNETGRKYLATRRKIDPEVIRQFEHIGISGLANIVAAIKLAKHLELTEDDVIMTVATDGAELYVSERQAYEAQKYPHGFDEINAGEAFGHHLEGIADDHVLELTHTERKRIFNLGYYTWVEQQGVSIEDFDRRRDQKFWRSLVAEVPTLNRLIEEMNADAGVGRPR
jgi:cysteine synthase A